MPWVDNGVEKKYVESRYLHDELPTWNEVYNEFWLNKAFSYNEERDSERKDPYLNIPYRKYLLMMMCNQLNKNLYEDNCMDKFIEFLNQNLNIDETNFTYHKNAKFMLLINYHAGKMLIDKGKNIDGVPNQIKDVINTIHPSKIVIRGGEALLDEYPIIYSTYKNSNNPFRDMESVKSTKRIYLEDLTMSQDIHLVLYISIKNDNNEDLGYMIYDKDFMEKAIGFMMKPYIEYFEGPGIGWKDENGNVIDSDKSHNCIGSGFDAAL